MAEHSQDYEDDEFPDARWKSHEVSSIIRDLMERFQARDDRYMLREALLFRRTWNEQRTGQYVPPPFNGSPTLIKHASGILIQRALHLSAKASENPPNVRVNVVTSSTGNATDKALTAAGNQQAALDAMEYEADLHADESQQKLASFYATVLGVGWYHEYENALGWQTPSRIYYDPLAEDEMETLRKTGKIERAIPDADGREFAESNDLWDRRKFEAMKDNALNGETLTIQEVLHPGSVYYRKDTRGISLVAVVEEVPLWDMMNEFGVVEDDQGNIVVGADLGAPAFGLETSGKTWIRIRLWTRDEVYYYVSRHQGGKPTNAGRIVYHSKHDYGEVPFWPSAAYYTGSSSPPEEEYIPLLEGAYAQIPGYNQLITLLSNASVFNATPRYIVIRNDGAPVMDPSTGDAMMFETDNVAGLDPNVTAVIEAGGEFRQLKIENVSDLVTLLEVYSQQLDDTLPPEAATGASSQHEPAWGTRLKQAAANIVIKPLVDNHARAKTKQNRWRSRIIKHRGRPVVLYARPKRSGEIAHARREITLKPEDISLNISVHQDDHDAQEKIILMQVGTELYDAKRIGPIKYYGDFLGEDDPLAAYKEAKAGELAEAIYANISVPRIMERVQGRIAPRTPNEIQAEGEANARPDVKSANPAEAAGVRQPAIGEAPTQNPLPPLGGAGAPAVEGALPVG